MRELLVVGVLGAGTAVWIAYWRWKDKHYPEPWKLLALALFGGALATLAALGGFALSAGLGQVVSWELLTRGGMLEATRGALIIGIVEESAKILPILPIAWTSRHFDEIWDGPVYAAAAGTGFACAENAYLWWGGSLDLLTLGARALSSPVTHALLAFPWGFGLAHMILQRRRWALALGFSISVVFHAGYDLALARPGGRWIAVVLILMIWITMLVLGRELTSLGPLRASALTRQPKVRRQ